MRTRTISLCTAVVLLNTAARTGGALEPGVAGQDVELFVSVTDDAQQLTRDLTQSDFEIYDNGKAQGITSFSFEPRAMGVVVLLDLSGSMKDTIGAAKTAVDQFLTHMRRSSSGFDPKTVARYTPERIATLTEDHAINRNRTQIEGAVRNPRAFVAIQREFGTFDAYSWQFVGGRPKVNRWKTMSNVPATSNESDALSLDLKRRGFSFAGSTIIYAFMQSVGMVNDHVVGMANSNMLRKLAIRHAQAWNQWRHQACGARAPRVVIADHRK